MISTLLFFLLCFLIIKKALQDTPDAFGQLLLFVLGSLLLFTIYEGGLHDWDERFHAVVAKNMGKDLLAPYLYADPILHFDYTKWNQSHLWFSKPIGGLLPMAISIKLFGAADISLRLPSLLLYFMIGTICYRTALRLSSSKVAYLTAFLFLINGLILEQVVGKVSSDHVDVVFLAVSTMIIFISTRMLSNGQLSFKESLALGGLLGLGFLVKWTMIGFALLPLLLLIFITYKNKKKAWLTIFIIGVTSLLIALPWVLYMYAKHPKEMTDILLDVLRPMGSAVQGHTGGPFYYLNQIRIVYGELIYLPIAFQVYQWHKTKQKINAFLLIWTCMPLILLSLAGTKRSTYILIAAPAYFMVTSIFFFAMVNLYKEKKKILVLILAIGTLALPMRYSLERAKPFKTKQVDPWKGKLAQTLEETKAKVAVYNEPKFLQAMYYFDILAYEKNLTMPQVDSLIQEGYEVYYRRDGEYFQQN